MYNYCFFIEHSSNIAEQNKKKIHVYYSMAYTCHLFAQDINIIGQKNPSRLPNKHCEFSFLWYENAGITIRLKRL